MEFLNILKTLFLGTSNYNFYGVNFSNIIIAVIVFFIFFYARSLISKIIFKKINFLFKFKNKKKIENFYQNTKTSLNLFVISIGFFLSSSLIVGSERIELFFKNVNVSLFTIFLFLFFSQIIHPLFLRIKNIEKILTSDLLDWIVSAIKIVIFFLGLTAVLELWGIRVGPVIAGLGLFGVAVALGAQDLFKNLISGILVLIEKRFKKGDVIIIENIIEGSVEKIGFRSTAIRKFDKSLCFIPNFQFAENAVTNVTEISNRRINWIIGLEYKSSTSQLRSICKDIEEKINNNKTDFFVSKSTPVIIKINEFAASSIDILVRCFANTNEYERFLEIKDNLAIEIKQIVEKRKASFAFPSQSIYVEKN
ncbi:MAG: mechanosensitive ion channel protein MscS [Rickettsiales bacterium]|nr:mechanosensitive ion channel protein MscS [Rickettsiales bacterium]